MSISQTTISRQVSQAIPVHHTCERRSSLPNPSCRVCRRSTGRRRSTSSQEPSMDISRRVCRTCSRIDRRCGNGHGTMSTKVSWVSLCWLQTTWNGGTSRTWTIYRTQIRGRWRRGSGSWPRRSPHTSTHMDTSSIECSTCRVTCCRSGTSRTFKWSLRVHRHQSFLSHICRCQTCKWMSKARNQSSQVSSSPSC